MKHKILILAALALLVTGCGVLRQSPEEKQRIAEAVMQRLDARDFRIDVNYMIPLRGGGRVISAGYSIAVKEGRIIDSHLPYIGAAYNVPYGGGKVLTFKDDIDEYSDSGWRNGLRTIAFRTDNDEDIIVYTLTVSSSGQTDIRVRSQNRDDISYRGVMDTSDQ